jgi:hypothetical protein
MQACAFRAVCIQHNRVVAVKLGLRDVFQAESEARSWRRVSGDSIVAPYYRPVLKLPLTYS